MNARGALIAASLLGAACRTQPPVVTPPPAASAAPAATPSTPPTPTCARATAAPRVEEVIARVDVQGSARVPLDKICAALRTQAGDILDDRMLQRDIHALWESGLFEDVVVSAEPSPNSSCSPASAGR